MTQPATDPLLGRGRSVAIVVGLLLGVFLATLDTTIVSAAVRTIADGLDGLSLQAWATTAYLVTSTLSTPLYGKLADILGRKPVYLASITIFLCGSVGCAISTSMAELAAFRAVQGMGTGGLVSLALVVISDIAALRQAARYQTAFVSVFSSANLIGPFIGGLLASQASILGITGWRWVFLINLPVGVVALVTVAGTLRRGYRRQAHRIDWAGAAAVAVAIVPVLLVSSQGSVWGWNSPAAIACYVTTPAGLVLFFVVERRMKEAAMIPLRLFRNRSFVLAGMAMLLVGVAMLGAMSLFPQYFQIVKGTSASTAGLLMLPVMIGLTVSSGVSSAVISRTGRYKIFPLLGLILMSVAMALFCLIRADTSLAVLEIYLAVFGIALGFSVQPLILTAQNAVPAADLSVATSLTTFFQQVGGIIGTAGLVAAVFASVVPDIGNALREWLNGRGHLAVLHDPAVSAHPVNAAMAHAVQHSTTTSFIGRILTNSTFVQQLDPRLARPFLVGFSQATTTGFLLGLVVVIGVVLMVFVREHPLPAERTVPTPRAAEPRNRPDDTPAEPTVPPGAKPFAWFQWSPARGCDVRGAVTSTAGAALPGVTVTLVDLAGWKVDQSHTGRCGRFVLCAPARGTYLLIAAAVGHRTHAMPMLVTGQPDPVDVALDDAGDATTAGHLPSGGALSRAQPTHENGVNQR